jgi:hypothetical protein
MTHPGPAATVVTMIDATHDNIDSIPATAVAVAGYVTGSGGVEWDEGDWDRFATAAKVRINQMPGSDPLLGDVLDVEPRAWTNEGAAQACRERKQRGLEISLYTFQDNLTPLLNACLRVGVTEGNLWVANWNLSIEEATEMVVKRSGPWPIQAVQWASPTSNPRTLIPGSNRTLREGNVDLSQATSTWLR